MVRRAVEAEEKRINKTAELIKKQSDDKNKKMEEERRQREKLLNCKVPEEGRRLTKSSENRANMVRIIRHYSIFYLIIICLLLFFFLFFFLLFIVRSYI